MARTHRSSNASDDVPKFFGKHGHAYEDPNKVKKNGAGRHNWGSEVDDIDDLAETGQFNFSRNRRRSNSVSMQQAARGLSGASSSSTDSDVFDEE